jgi:uncharacterized protein involved in exopolysaccharide biosynthesis
MMTNSPGPAVPSAPDSLDVTRYLAALKRRWHIVVLCGVLGAVAAFAYSALQAETYRSTVDVAIVRSGTVVNLDPKFMTVSDINSQSLDQITRRPSLLAIARSLTLAERVVQTLGPQLPETLRVPARLSNRVRISGEGDLIRIETTVESPELAALISGTWASLYTARLNEILNESAVSLEAVQTQADEAEVAYKAREQELINVIASSGAEELRRRRDAIAGLLDAQAAVEHKMHQLEQDARALRARVAAETGSVGAGDQLAELLIHSNAYNNVGDLPLQLDVPVDPSGATISRSDLLARLDSLIASIAARRVASGSEPAQELNQELAEIQADVERAEAHIRELTAARDLAWETYQLLTNKVAETKLALATPNQFARIAVPANVPSDPIESRRILNTLIGGLLGLIVGALIALALDALPARTAVLQRASG